jgi:hypothetical protein
MRNAILIAAGAALWLLAACGALAAGTRDPLELPLRQYGAMLAAALLGGFVSWIGRVRAGQAAITVFSFVGEMCTSAFAGLLCFWTLEAWGIDRLGCRSSFAATRRFGAASTTRRRPRCCSWCAACWASACSACATPCPCRC